MIKRNRTIRQTEGAQEGQGVFWKSKQLLVLCFFLRQILGYNGIAFGIYRQYYGNYKPIANFVQPTFRLPVHTCLFHATTWILCSMKMRMRKSKENFNIITTALVFFFYNSCNAYCLVFRWNTTIAYVCIIRFWFNTSNQFALTYQALVALMRLYNTGTTQINVSSNFIPNLPAF